MAILFLNSTPHKTYIIESKLKVLLLLVSEIAAILENDRHNRPRRNLAWHYSYIYLFWYNVHVCQVSCFYHKMHDFPLICWANWPFKLNTSQNCSVEFGCTNNPRNGEVVLDDTLVRLRNEQDAFRINQEKTHLFFCTACCRREQVSCDWMTMQ